MLIKNNKGYFLAETIIVLTVVALAITTLYVNSMESYINENNSLTKYNTIDGLYSANAVKKYLYEYLDEFKKIANEKGYVDVQEYLNKNNVNMDFFKNLDVKQVYFSTYNMSKLIDSKIIITNGASNIQKELIKLENDNRCSYKYIVIYNDYSYSVIGVDCV